MKECEWCGKLFKPKRKDSRLCSASCKKACYKAEHHARYVRRKDEYRDQNYQKKFGITLEDYNQMFADQEGHCAICGVHQLDVSLTFAVDHDHKTGEVRGLLCGPCNTGLGHFRDDTTVLAKAIAYLNKE